LYFQKVNLPRVSGRAGVYWLILPHTIVTTCKDGKFYNEIFYVNPSWLLIFWILIHKTIGTRCSMRHDAFCKMTQHCSVNWKKIIMTSHSNPLQETTHYFSLKKSTIRIMERKGSRNFDEPSFIDKKTNLKYFDTYFDLKTIGFLVDGNEWQSTIIWSRPLVSKRCFFQCSSIATTTLALLTLSDNYFETKYFWKVNQLYSDKSSHFSSKLLQTIDILVTI
jgi:hypothetical protein